MRIAVNTPRGNVGRHVVAGLIRAGVRPVVLVRDASRLDQSLLDWVEPVVADSDDPEALVEATRGVDTLYWVAPPTAAADPVAAHSRSGAHAARAVTVNGISRIVFQSSIGAEKRRGAGEIDGLARTEQLLDATGADVVHLRCGFFYSNLLMELDAIRAGVIRVLLPVDQPMAWVAPRDIADVAVGHLLNPDWSGRNVHAVHGPTDLSWEQAAAIISDVVDRPVRAERVPDAQMRAVLDNAGLTTEVVEAIIGMSTGLRDGFTPEQRRSVATTTPTSLAAWCFDELRPAL